MMIKLNQSGSIVSLENVAQVKEVVTPPERGYTGNKERAIKITYKNGNVIFIEYGRDEHYYDTYNGKLRADMKQIEDVLIKSEVSP